MDIEAAKAEMVALFNELHMIKYQAVGSRVSCNPPPENSDYDFLVLCPESEEFHPILRNAGWDWLGSETYGASSSSPFNTYRKGELNIIVTQNDVFYDDFLLATAVAKEINLMRKVDRITLFQAILYRNAPGDHF